MELPPPPERSKRLHNFTLPYLQWGQRRFLRCVKLPNHRSPSFPSSSSSSPSPSSADHRSLVGELKVDLVYDDNKPKVSVLGNGGGGGGEEKSSGEVIAARPWNLRTRRAACTEPGDESTRIVESSSMRRHEIGVKRGVDRDGDLQKKNEKVKFSVPLMREEIEQDFSALIGKKPPRRPKKRPRLVQKQMNTLFPGLWLSEEITADSYNVPEAVET